MTSIRTCINQIRKRSTKHQQQYQRRLPYQRNSHKYWWLHARREWALGNKCNLERVRGWMLRGMNYFEGIFNLPVKGEGKPKA